MADRNTKDDGDAKKRLGRKSYEKELSRLQAELVKLQFFIKTRGERIVVVFEGRDAAGKGGVIKRITERVSPRTFRVVALPAPDPRERTQLYGQRYLTHFPAAGEIVLFDRSWYNRAGVEQVMSFCTEEEYEKFLETVPFFERMITRSGVRLIKYWLEVSQDEQTSRFKERMTDPRKLWKLSPMDLEAHRRWYDYSRARDKMLEATHSPWGPWHVVMADDKRRARLNCITHLLTQIPYEDLERPKIKLPKRQASGGYEEADLSSFKIPEVY